MGIRSRGKLGRTSLVRAFSFKTALALSFTSLLTFSSFAPVLSQDIAQETVVEQEFSIKAAITDHPRQVIKNGKYFIILSETGALPASSPYGNGLYKDDTRYLSCWDITLNGLDTVLLQADCQKGYAGTFSYANKSFEQDGQIVPEQSILLKREIVITDAHREKFTLTNYHRTPLKVTLSIKFDADYADMFEVRGQKRAHRGKRMATKLSKDRNYVVLSYKGLDDKLMSTKIGMRSFSAKEKELGAREGKFTFEMAPHQTAWVETTTEAIFDNEEPLRTFDSGFATEMDKAEQAYKTWLQSVASIKTNDPDTNKIIERSYRDLYMLRLPTTHGMAVAAGIPWYAVPFGRDQIITAWKMLPLMPDMAKEVLSLLSYHMGTTSDTAREEEPGRIMHELRAGEMARLKEIPFVPYYGTVDATPLYLILFSDYCKQTNDLNFAKEHWDKVKLALSYLDSESNKGEKYLVYGKMANAALSNQGWKDSSDSITNSDGSLARPPIAVCEVQGYLYKSWLNIADLAELLGHSIDAKRYRLQAARLKERFNIDFWDKELNMPVIALNGDGSRCSVVSSNAGHLLFTGILSPERNKIVSARLLEPDMFSGFGIRTLAMTAKAYNPMSYHNGTVWPHDNCMIAQGLIRTSEKTDLLNALLSAANTQDQGRLPELFCGFSKEEAKIPLRYPVSCAPQAWAAATIPNLVFENLGLNFVQSRNEMHVTNPHLPRNVDWLEIDNLQVGDKKLRLKFSKEADKITVLNSSPSCDVKIIQK